MSERWEYCIDCGVKFEAPNSYKDNRFCCYSCQEKFTGLTNLSELFKESYLANKSDPFSKLTNEQETGGSLSVPQGQKNIFEPKKVSSCVYKEKENEFKRVKRKLKDLVWEKAEKIQDYDPNEYRKDASGNVIDKNCYGKDTLMGWHIDHIIPLRLGGSNDLSNLQVLQSSQNKAKGAKYPYNHADEPRKGISEMDFIKIYVDKRCIHTVDEDSQAVKNSIKVKLDEQVDRDSMVVKSGQVLQKRKESC